MDTLIGGVLVAGLAISLVAWDIVPFLGCLVAVVLFLSLQPAGGGGPGKRRRGRGRHRRR